MQTQQPQQKEEEEEEEEGVGEKKRVLCMRACVCYLSTCLLLLATPRLVCLCVPFWLCRWLSSLFS